MNTTTAPTLATVIADLDAIIRTGSGALPPGTPGHLVQAMTHLRQARRMEESHARANWSNRPAVHRGCPVDH